jgi:hypothetical protein
MVALEAKKLLLLIISKAEKPANDVDQMDSYNDVRSPKKLRSDSSHATRYILIKTSISSSLILNSPSDALHASLPKVCLKLDSLCKRKDPESTCTAFEILTSIVPALWRCLNSDIDNYYSIAISKLIAITSFKDTTIRMSKQILKFLRYSVRLFPFKFADQIQNLVMCIDSMIRSTIEEVQAEAILLLAAVFRCVSQLPQSPGNDILISLEQMYFKTLQLDTKRSLIIIQAIIEEIEEACSKNPNIVTSLGLQRGVDFLVKECVSHHLRPSALKALGAILVSPKTDASMLTATLVEQLGFVTEFVKQSDKLVVCPSLAILSALLDR